MRMQRLMGERTWWAGAALAALLGGATIVAANDGVAASVNVYRIAITGVT